MNKKTILCFLPLVGDTKDSKRIQLLMNAGFNIKVISFERQNHSPRKSNWDVKIIGNIEDGKYFARIITMLRAFQTLRYDMQSSDIVYCLSADLAIFAYLASFGMKVQIVVDVADIREIQVKRSILGALYRLIDKLVSRKFSLIVVTSEFFITEYYDKWLNIGRQNYYLLENKVDYSAAMHRASKIKLSDSSKIKLGYIGYIRDNWTIKLLLELVSQYPEKYEIHIAGIDQLTEYDLNKLTASNRGIYYYGPYKSPEDLLSIYNSFDVMVLFYPEYASNENWFNAKRICRSNRYYESCFFGKPLIAFSFSADGRIISMKNIGLTLDTYSIKNSARKIVKEVTHKNILKWKRNISNLAVSEYCFTNEVKTLRHHLNKSTFIK